MIVQANIRDATAVAEMIATAVREMGRLDILINNAGIYEDHPLAEVSYEKWQESWQLVLDTNLTGPANTTFCAAQQMIKQGGGRIVNVSSMSRYVSAPIASSYAATKGGMEAMTTCLRLELAPWNIKLSLVVPGFVDTPTFENSREAGKEIRHDPSNPYRDLIGGLEEFTEKQLQSAISPAETAEIVWKAATAANPKVRYFAPKSVGTAARMFAMMPTSLAERILLGMYKWELRRNDDVG